MLDEQKRNQLGILVKIATVDEEFDSSEKEIIVSVAGKYGASVEELKEILDMKEFSEDLGPMSDYEKIDFFLDCMDVILADDVVTSSEKSFGITIADKLGFDHKAIQLIVDNKSSSRSDQKELLGALL